MPAGIVVGFVAFVLIAFAAGKGENYTGDGGAFLVLILVALAIGLFLAFIGPLRF